MDRTTASQNRKLQILNI
jgi:hypothetical protein